MANGFCDRHGDYAPQFRNGNALEEVKLGRASNDIWPYYTGSPRSRTNPIPGHSNMT